MKNVATYPLRLPRFLKEAVARIAKEEGTSINQFVVVAVAEKLAALETNAYDFQVQNSSEHSHTILSHVRTHRPGPSHGALTLSSEKRRRYAHM